MNARFDKVFQKYFSNYEKIFSGKIADQLPQGYLEIAPDFLDAMKEFGFVKSYALEGGVKVDWAPMDEIKRLYPTVRGDNPNQNIMAAVQASLEAFCRKCDVVMESIPLGSFEKFGYRQASRDFLEFAQNSGMIESYVLYPKREFVMTGPSAYLTPAQLEKLANKNKPRDLSIR